MPGYLVLLHGGRADRSARSLGHLTDAMVAWLDGLRRSGSLVSTAVVDHRPLDAAACCHTVSACVVVEASTVAEARAVAASCPDADVLHDTVVPLRVEAVPHP